MSRTEILVEIVLDDARLTLDELCRAGAVSPQWVMQHVEEGLLAAPGGAPRGWRFDVQALRRVRRIVDIERNFDAAPELAALVADLIDEVGAMRMRLRRAGLE